MKITLSGNIPPIIYGIPLFLLFYTIAFFVFGYEQGNLTTMLTGLAFIYMAGIVLLLLFRQCKNIYFDQDYIYVHTPFKNKLIQKVALEHVDSVRNYILFIKITFHIDSSKYKVYTVQDRKAIHEAYGLHEVPGFKRFWGKPNYKLEVLKKSIKNKSRSYPNNSV